MTGPKPALLVVLDGWGLGEGDDHDAIARADTPNMDAWREAGGFVRLHASGPYVGLPEGQMGNSEVGHLNIGAGRVVPQDFVRINQAVADGSIADNPVLSSAFERAQGSRLHLLGLLGTGGVHSHHDHMLAVLDAAHRAGVEDIVVHHILDGRDTPPQSAKDFAADFEARRASIGAGRVATVAGRYFTMDRDSRWERTLKGYHALVEGIGNTADDAVSAIEDAYGRGETDEFVEPAVVDPHGAVRDGDVVVCTNFRPDRMRQLVRMLKQPRFHKVERTEVDVHVVTMTLYDAEFSEWGVEIAFPPDHPQQTLGAVYADAGLKQLRTAETEKYAHVTYFFNGGVEAALEGEDRVLVPSPRVATYDAQPEMSAEGVTQEILKGIAAGYPLVVANYANADMLGHTGILEATVRACSTVDQCLGRVVAAAHEAGYMVMITADHGNAEGMMDPEGRPQTSHTSSMVPLHVLPADGSAPALADEGSLADVAPTLLELVGLDAPDEMTGVSLVQKAA